MKTLPEKSKVAEQLPSDLWLTPVILKQEIKKLVEFFEDAVKGSSRVTRRDDWFCTVAEAT